MSLAFSAFQWTSLRKEETEALRQSEEKYRILVESSLQEWLSFKRIISFIAIAPMPPSLNTLLKNTIHRI
jgi:hypothetical protein